MGGKGNYTAQNQRQHKGAFTDIYLPPAGMKMPGALFTSGFTPLNDKSEPVISRQCIAHGQGICVREDRGIKFIVRLRRNMSIIVGEQRIILDL